MLHTEFSSNPVPRISWQSIQLGDLIGNGSFGDVYRGLHGGRDVAVKVLQIKTLPAHLAQDFDNETRIMWQCKFDNILDLYGICTEPGHYSIVMENMSRGSLSQFLRDPQQEISKKLLWQIAIDTAEGLAYLHAKDILHRDLKSNNILLNEKYCAKISDFGLSKLKLEIKSTSTTSTARQTGTIRWRAPELFKRGAIASKASDIYSYGMVLWELVTRKLPFNDAADETTVMGWIKDGEQENIPDDCPQEWKEIITSCWSAPENRPQAKEIVSKLKQAQTALEKVSASIVSSQEQLRGTVMSVATIVAAEKPSREANLQPVQNVIHHVEKFPEAEINVPHKSVEKQLITNSGDNGSKKGGLAIYLEMHNVPPSELTPLDNTALSSSSFVINPQYLAKFLKHIGFGEQDEAEAMLKEHLDLASSPGDLTDCAGRNFKQITGLQYAVWALDWHMWKMLQRYLPQEEVKKQLDNLETGFLVTEHGAQTSWQNLIEAFQTYIANYDKWSDKQCRTHWLQQIGGAQLLLPAHVINEYNRPDRSFYPCPEFKELILPRTGMQNWKTHGSSKWLLGRDFAWVRGELTSGCVFSAEAGTIANKEQWFARIVNIVVAPDARTCTPCEHDPVALTTLFFSRQAQRAQLISLFKRIAPITTTSSSSSSHITTSASSTIIISPEYVPSITLQPNTSAKIQNQEQTQTIETERLKVEPAQAEEITRLQAQLEQVKITSSASYSSHSFPQNSPVLSPAPNLSTSSIMVNFRDLTKFLKHIGFGEQDEAETMLKINPGLALTSDNLTDCAGRQFKQITGFQYAVWALDWHMWNMLRKYMPEDEVKKQFMELEIGVCGDHGIRVSWQKLIDVLQGYITNYGKYKYNKLNEYWCRQVGGEQLLLPAHVINEYSRLDQAFSPCPKFDEDLLPRIGVDFWKFFNGRTLGSTFAWRRGGKLDGLISSPHKSEGGNEYACPESAARLDANALDALFEARIKQYSQLKIELEPIILSVSNPNVAVYSQAKPIKTIQGHASPISCFRLLSNRELASSSAEDNIIKIWDLRSGNCIKNLIGHTKEVSCLQLLSTGDLVSGSDDNLLKIWDLKKGICIKNLTGHTDAIYCLEVLANGELISGSRDGSIKVWDLQSGNCIKTLTGHTNSVLCLQILPGGELLSGAWDNTIKVWDLKSSTCIKTLIGHTNAVSSLLLLTNGDLVSCSKDNTIKIWDLKKGNCIKTLTDHTNWVSCIQLLPSGELLSSSNDRTIKIWDLRSGICVKTLTGHTSIIYCLQLLPSGELISGSYDGIIKIWNLLEFTLTNKPDGQAHNISAPVYDTSSSAINFSAITATYQNNLTKLLRHIGFGEQDEAEAILKENQDLTLVSGNLTDCAKRHFKQITGFQYAVWALDWHMWNMLQKYMSPEAVKEQLSGLETEPWVRIHGIHASWKNLVDALQNYIDHFEMWNDNQRTLHWCKQVGGSQLLLPAHVVNEYTRPDRTFRPCPEFNELVLPRTGIHRWAGGVGANNTLGLKFAWWRCGDSDIAQAKRMTPNGMGEANMRYSVLSIVDGDRRAVNALFRYREEQRAQLILSQVKPNASLIVINYQKDLTRFLRHIGFGEQIEAEEMLKVTQDLALVPGDLIDCAGRKFKQITGFQYAVWALDWHMWKMLQKYMAPEAVKEQLDSLEIGSWIEEYGANISWKNLIDALQKYSDNYSKWTVEQYKSYWLQQIAGAQRLLPAHVINEYSRPDRPFHPCPTFNENFLPRTGCYDWTNLNGVGTLGINFAWIRYTMAQGCTPRGVGLFGSTPEHPVGEQQLNAEVVTLSTLLVIRIEQRCKLLSSVGFASQLFTTISVNQFSTTNSPSSSEFSSCLTQQHNPVLFSTPKPNAGSIAVNPMDVSVFLSHIGFGRQYKAEAMLIANRDLGLVAGNLTDCAERNFKQITGFQYALWALDWHMLEMLKKHLSEEALQEQVQGLAQGAWIQEYGSQVSWQNLIDALQKYVDNYLAWTARQCNIHWCQQVGAAQLMLPAHVIQEYSRQDRSFYPCPQFNENQLPRQGTPLLQDWRVQACGNLGVNFAWYRDKVNGCAKMCDVKTFFGFLTMPEVDTPGRDHAALVALQNLRMQQCAKLIANVMKHISSSYRVTPSV